MSIKTPHIIIENGIEYQLGQLKNNHLKYDFQKILTYLEAKGKLLFGDAFKIYQKDIPIIYKLCVYSIQDHETCKKLQLNPQKGILLTGPVGCGKTSLMKLVRHIVPHQKPYKITPARNTVFSFNHLGFKTIEDYGNDGYYCFDDLGVEPTGRHYGKDCNVMGEILLSRYELFCRMKANNNSTHKTQGKTHATTNLNAQELEDRYGNRVRSRMRQLFNLIAFQSNCIDKRI